LGAAKFANKINTFNKAETKPVDETNIYDADYTVVDDEIKKSD